MTTRRNILMAGITAATLALSALGASAQTVTLRSADTHPDGYPTVEAVKFMGQLIEQRTNGRYKIQIFPASTLGQEKDTVEQTRFGVIDLNRVNMAPLNNLIPETAVPGLPFVFRSVDHMRKVMDGPIGEEILKAFEPHGMVGLAYYDSGARSFYNSKRPVTKLEDLKGLKIRVQQSDMFIALVNALGANATPMAFGEVYSALQTGVIDGAENNWPSYESTRHFEVSKHYSLTEHSMTPEVLVMSKRSWDKLSDADKVIFRAAAKESVARMRQLWEAREKTAEEAVKAKGAMITQVDKKPFIDAMKPVYDKFVTDAKLKDLLARIQAVQ
jgi:tripartite ATP-independent transporter DctP family solute receptor